MFRTKNSFYVLFLQTLPQLRLQKGARDPYLGLSSITGNISPPSFSHESQLALPADDMWADAGLYSCAGPYMPIHQPVILEKWNKVTSGKQLPAGTKSTPAAQHSHPPIRPCSHDPSSSVTQLTGTRACSNWATRSTSTAPHDVRDAWLPNIENGPICLYDLYQSQVLSCISLATRGSCRWAQTIIHQKKVYSLKYLSTQWCSWWLRWEALVWFMRRFTISAVWIAIVEDNEQSVASGQNWRSTDWCECV